MEQLQLSGTLPTPAGASGTVASGSVPQAQYADTSDAGSFQASTVFDEFGIDAQVTGYSRGRRSRDTKVELGAAVKVEKGHRLGRISPPGCCFSRRAYPVADSQIRYRYWLNRDKEVVSLGDTLRSSKAHQ